MIIVDGIMYLGLEKNKYLSYDLNDPNSPLGTDLIDQLDPSSMADVFEEGMTGSRYIGEDEKQGESMEHYRVAVNAAAVFDVTLATTAPITFDVWFDDEGYLRQQRGRTRRRRRLGRADLRGLGRRGRHPRTARVAGHRAAGYVA